MIRAPDVWNALTAHIAVLDGEGKIVAVNDAWRRFAEGNAAQHGDAFVGSNYIEICEAGAAAGDVYAAQALAAIRAALAGQRDEISFEYPCHSADEERWFLMRATQLGGEPGVVIAHENITARRRAENALREAEQTLRQVLETLPVGVWRMDATGRIVYGNPAGQRIWAGARYVPPEAFGEYKGWWVNSGRPVAADDWAAARAIRKGEISLNEEIEIECFDGTHKFILNSAMPLRSPDGRIEGAIIVNQDITPRKHAENELEKAKLELEEALVREQVRANVDGLTGASNRRHFFELAEQEVAVAKRYAQPIAVILFDLDHFKEINDTRGHQAGDELLHAVAVAARAHLRAPDVLARYGGEEFIVLLPQTRAAAAGTVAERMRQEIHAQTSITISSGVAELKPGEEGVDAMIRRADEALYAAKRQGRNRTIVAS